MKSLFDLVDAQQGLPILEVIEVNRHVDSVFRAARLNGFTEDDASVMSCKRGLRLAREMKARSK